MVSSIHHAGKILKPADDGLARVPVEDRRPVGSRPGPTNFDEPKCPKTEIIDEKANLAQFVASDPICPTGRVCL